MKRSEERRVGKECRYTRSLRDWSSDVCSSDLKPDEIYHLGAQSHVRVSFDIPEYTSDVTGVGTIRILEAIREAGLRSRFLQASSSEMFGKAQEVPQNEKIGRASCRERV